MKKSILSLSLLAISICGFTQNKNTTTNNTKNGVEVKVFNRVNPVFLVGGVAFVLLRIENNTEHEISFALQYPDPSELSFDAQSSLEEKEPEYETIDVRTPITTISPGKAHEIVYYLNRYFNFTKEGKFEIFYSFKTTFDVKNSKPINGVYEGKFYIELVNPSSVEELKKNFAYYSDRLKSDDRTRRQQSAEALSYTGNPLCIDYIIPMLSIEGLEITGINALSRFNTDRTKKLISDMLSHKDFMVKQAAEFALESMNEE